MPITYRQAGVDIDAGDALVERIKPLARSTRTPFVLADVGGFAGLCGLPPGMREPVLVSGTDGVGTKLKVAFAAGKHDTIGQDLVAMCVNDVATSGALPLFFLDYFATGKLDVETAAAVVGGIAEGCRLAGCALLGGETAEMPGMYAEGEYDLAGFAVGVVERDEIIDGRATAEGDVVVGLPSSGLHSNGYSLARRVLLGRHALGDRLPELGGATLGEALLAPTRIYARALRALLEGHRRDVHALAHITGGGLVGNVPRVLPEGLGVELDQGAWAVPPLMRRIAEEGPVAEDEMRRTFNLGVGMVILVAPAAAEGALARLRAAGEAPFVAGRVVACPAGAPDEARVAFRGE
ncbi:MAG TPA: phosphoribosylformylglycinamidine cyclo-ligase [Polyangiaceae bacterium]|nr:phosphoribosylformylglycinamidine cyclo-ligase [Polyangiaceae bacterium]